MRLPLVFLGLLIAACDGSGSVKQPEQEPQAEPEAVVAGEPIYRHAGKLAPDVTLIRKGGGPLSLTAFRGQPILVNLWATWCAPCVAEMPALDRLAEQEGYDLSVVLISQDSEGWEKIDPFLAETPIRYASVLADPSGAMSTALGEPGLPVSVLYDAAGKEVWRVVGPREWDAPGGLPPLTPQEEMPADQAGEMAADAGLAEKGVRYVARGQEPGWLVTLMPGGKIEVLADYGETKADFPAPANMTFDPLQPIGPLASGDHSLEMSATAESCTDPMSGAAYPQTVTMELDGRTYSGCGRPLTK